MTDWLRSATVDHVHDGDTVIVDIDLGKIARVRKSQVDLGWHVRLDPDGHVRLRNAIRIQGLAAPELSTAAGKEAAAFAKTLMAPGDVVTIDSLALYGSFEKYGRVLAGVELADGRDFATVMIEAGHGVYWDGTGKQPGSVP